MQLRLLCSATTQPASSTDTEDLRCPVPPPRAGLSAVRSFFPSAWRRLWAAGSGALCDTWQAVGQWPRDVIDFLHGDVPRFLWVGGRAGQRTYRPQIDCVLEARELLTTTNVLLHSSFNPSTFGQPLSIATAVTAADGTMPTGSIILSDNGAPAFTATLIGGQTTWTPFTPLTGGTHLISAQYTPDITAYDSSSGNLVQQVLPGITTTTLTDVPNPSTYGQPVNFTATVTAPGPVPPSGFVTFTVDGTPQGSLPLSGPTVSYTAFNLTAGSHSVTATYSGSINYAASTSAPATHLISQAATTTTLFTTPNPALAGDPVTLTAVVTPSTAALPPTGTVTFFIDGTPQTPVALTGNSASFTAVGLSVGMHSLSVVYSGEVNYSGSSSTLTPQVVSPYLTTTALVTAPNPSSAGQAVTFTAGVTGGGLPPTGTVTFTVDGLAQAPVTLTGGFASFTTSTLFVGTHSVSVAYSGDATHSGSSATAVTQIVNPAQSQTVVFASANPALVNQPITLTALVSGTSAGAGTPTGSVSFTVDGTAPLPAFLTDGVASVTLPSLGLGTHTVQASYFGDPTFSPSFGSFPALTVIPYSGQSASQTAVSVSASPTVYGQAVRLTATVSAQGASGTPTGSVTFFVDNASQGTVALAQGQATFSTANLGVGTHTIFALYTGDNAFLGSTGFLPTLKVQPAATQTVVTSSANPSLLGDPVTFTAQVSVAAPGAGSPTGTVVFFIDGQAKAPVTLQAGRATFTTTSLTVGTHTVSASYSGSGTFLGSSGDLPTQQVRQYASQAALTSSLNPSIYGQSVTFTATVSAPSGVTATPTGSVVFTIDGVAQPGVTLASGQAGVTTVGLLPGDHSVSVVYAGNTAFTGSSATLPTQTVQRVGTTTTLASSRDPSLFGQAVTLTATVRASAPAGGTPSGTVTFFDGTTPLATIALTGTGIATYRTTTLAAGARNITATYNGNTLLATSTSAAVSQLVQANTATRVTASANPAVVGQAVTFTATVTPSGGATGTPTGTVTFSVGGVAVETDPLVNGAASYTTGPLALGPLAVSAAYSGDPIYHASTSPVLTETVNPAKSAVVLAGSPNPVLTGQPVTLTATVSAVAPGSGTPGGTVTFSEGTVTLATVNLVGGAASFTTSTFSTGTHRLTASYGGSANFKVSTSAVSSVIVQANTTTSLTASAGPSVVGQTVTFTATVAAVAPGTGTPAGQVVFTVDNVAQAPVTLSGGIARFATNTLSLGGHTVRAAFAGSSTYLASASAALTQTVNPASTRTVLSAPLTPAVGRSTTVTATVSAVSPGTGIPAGTVTFFDNGATLGTAAVVNGVATFTGSAFALGTHRLTATFASATASYLGSTAAARTMKVVVNQPPVANADFFATFVNTPVGGTVLANDTDPNSDPLTATVSSGPGHAAAFTFNPRRDVQLHAGRRL